MLAAFEFGGEPDLHDAQGLGFGHGALAEGEDVAVVVGAVPDRNLLRPAQAAADALDLVGGDGLAVAGAAQDDAALVVAAGDGFRGRADEVGVVAGLGGPGPEVMDGVALGEDMALMASL